jgi:hypothetical protein
VLRSGGRNTVLETTSLVHESYLRFVSAGELRAEDRRLCLASHALGDPERRAAVQERRAERRGGDAPHLTLHTELAESLSGNEETILKVHEALLALEQADARLAKVVEMRYFGG